MARAGDVVVRGGHAGILMGPVVDGEAWGMANNGSPAYSRAGPIAMGRQNRSTFQPPVERSRCFSGLWATSEV